MYDSRPAHLRGGVTHEDRVAIIRELDSYDPLRLALREPSDELIAQAETAIRAQTYDIRGNAWPTFIRAVLAALAEAVTPDGFADCERCAGTGDVAGGDYRCGSCDGSGRR
jgi:hypothetical protein